MESGFVLATEVTPASHHDSPYLPYCVTASCHTDKPIEVVYADKGYFGEPNRSFLNLNRIKDGIMRKDTTTAKLTEYEIERNKGISKKRYIAAPCGITVSTIEDKSLHNVTCLRNVEHLDLAIPRGKKQYFGLSHLYHGASRARFTTIFKNAIDAMTRQMVFNLFRGSKILSQTN